MGSLRFGLVFSGISVKRVEKLLMGQKVDMLVLSIESDKRSSDERPATMDSLITAFNVFGCLSPALLVAVCYGLIKM